ncbi:hypothetical protein JCM17380_15540 [Desulfosporosinus burensis]
MKLSEFKIENFRSHKLTDWVKVHDLTAFIGENDGGKTASTDALRLLFSTPNKPEEGDYTWDTDGNGLCQCDEIIIEAKLLPVKESEKEIVTSVLGEISEVHIKKKWKKDGTSIFTIIGQVSSIQEFQSNWKGNVIGDLKSLAEKYHIDLVGKSLKADIVGKISEWVDSQPKATGEMAMVTEIQKLLPRVEVFSSSKALDPERVVNDVLRSICNTEIASDKYYGQITEIEAGITEVLCSKVDELTPYIQTYYTEVDSVIIEPHFSISSGLSPVTLKLLEMGGAPIELRKKGDGKKRQVTLGIYEWSTKALSQRGDAEQDIILILDEPDTHMDYSSQRKLFDILCRYGQIDIQVIICTHSMNLINRMQLNKINHFRLSSIGRTIIDSLNMTDTETEDLFINEIGLGIGLDNGTMFHERCFLIVEGPTEMHTLPQLFRLVYEQSMQSAGIKLINGENNAGARAFAKFLNTHNRNVVFLLDNDCNTGPSKRLFNRENLERDGFNVDEQVFFIGVNEFEDSFSDEVIASVGNVSFTKTEGVWCKQDIVTLRETGNKFSEGLSRLFRDTKPNIGYAMGRFIDNKDQIPDKIIQIFNRTYQVANNDSEARRDVG